MGRIRESDMSSPQKIKNKNQKEEGGKRKEGRGKREGCKQTLKILNGKVSQ